MAMAVAYSNFGGMIIHENRGGTKTAYVGDTLGSMAKCLDSGGNETYNAEYWPYGDVPGLRERLVQMTKRHIDNLTKLLWLERNDEALELMEQEGGEAAIFRLAASSEMKDRLVSRVLASGMTRAYLSIKDETRARLLLDRLLAQEIHTEDWKAVLLDLCDLLGAEIRAQKHSATFEEYLKSILSQAASRLHPSKLRV